MLKEKESIGDQPSTEDNQTSFAVERMFIKDLSFEPKFKPHEIKEWNTHLDVDMSTEVNQLEKDYHEVTLVLTVTVKISEKTIFLVEINQSGIFLIKNFKQENMRSVLGSLCPSILYPYAVQAVTDIVIRGGFPPLYLGPVNFDALLAEQDAKSGETTH